jgi:hypothetical protein
VYEGEFFWKEIFCTYIITADSGTTLAIGKGHFLSSVVKGSAEGRGLLSRGVYGELQIYKKTKSVNRKTINTPFDL